MPDLKEATNHLAPLSLPAQMAVHFPVMKTRVGFEVRSLQVSEVGAIANTSTERILLRSHSFERSATGSASGC